MNINKTILVTGSTGNLGNYLLNYYLDKKFNVIGISRNKKFSHIDNFYACDLSNTTKVNIIFKKIRKKFKRIDLIISCAGDSKKTYKVNENIKDWKSSFNNNFYSFANLLDAYIKTYKKNPTKIIVISSIASNKITKAPITYSVAKSALNFYAQIKAKEFAKYDIKLNILLPGNILMKNNNWSKKLKANRNFTKKYIKENVPLNKFCKPEQISAMCDYLFNKSGDVITGSKFIIDGGETL
jgi:NAD(P)-dependent dehydrogenase (short-subunit alcohol dehydrogenase family)